MKYYSFCKMSPSRELYRKQYRLVNSKAPEGFIFHDTEAPLDVEALRTPLFKLAQLFDQPKDALVFRINSKTLVASYSVVAIPQPTLVININAPRASYYSNDTSHLKLYPTTDELPGWYISDIYDKSATVLPFDIGNMYDNCTQLQRIMGSCPCVHKDNGVCVAENVLPAFNGAITVDRLESDYYASFTERVKGMLVRNYSEVGGFHYVSPAYTTDQDFYKGLRPWDDIDFSHVDARMQEFKERGEQRKKKNQFVKTQCDDCVFARQKTIYKNGRSTDRTAIKACMPITNCAGSSSEADAIRVLEHYNAQHGLINNSQFTPDEIHALLQLTGQTFKARTPLSKHKSLLVELTGFRRTRGSRYFEYNVSAAKGDLRRTTVYATYAELLKDIPKVADHLEKLKLFPSYHIPYPKEALWACALLSRASYQSTGWGNHADLRKISVIVYPSTPNQFSVDAQYCNGRRTWGGIHLDMSNFPKAWLSPYVTSNNGQVKTLAQRVTTNVTSRATQSTD